MADMLQRIRKCRQFVASGFDAARPPPLFSGNIDASALIIGQAPGLYETLSRVIQECNLQDAKIDIGLLKHIRPMGWENIILYKEYILNRSLILI